jgi:alkylation response protein AidB-like acyl-CoA dehydrogenase
VEKLFASGLEEVSRVFNFKPSRELLERVEKAAEELIVPEVEHYLEHRFDEQIPIILSKHALTGLPISRKYGGEGADMLTYSLCIQRLGQLGMSVVSFVSVHTSLCGFTIQQWGNEEQKGHYLAEATSGKRILAFALTEPTAGSDPGALETSYSRDDGKFILNGEKYLISNGGIANDILVFARNKADGQISCFIVNSKSDGFRIEMELKEKIGLFTSNTVMFSLSDVEVKKEDMLGLEGKGLTIAYTSLMSGRLGVSSGSLGIIDDCLNSVLERAKTRKQHGKEIGKHQLIQSHIAAITADREQARWPTYMAAIAKQRYNENHQNKELRAEADYRIALAKRIASKCAFDASDRAVQVFGGFGYSILSSPARHFCDSRVTRIYEGTDEILDLKIASTQLGPDYQAFA